MIRSGSLSLNWGFLRLLTNLTKHPGNGWFLLRIQSSCIILITRGTREDHFRGSRSRDNLLSCCNVFLWKISYLPSLVFEWSSIAWIYINDWINSFNHEFFWERIEVVILGFDYKTIFFQKNDFWIPPFTIGSNIQRWGCGVWSRSAVENAVFGSDWSWDPQLSLGLIYQIFKAKEMRIRNWSHKRFTKRTKSNSVWNGKGRGLIF